MNIQLKKVVEITEGTPSPGNLEQPVTSVASDSRNVSQGSLFVAFKGENVDGHDFLTDCRERGAAAALVERDLPVPQGLVAIRVDNTQSALQRLGAWQRQQFPDLKVLAVTGSSGKTTTKELIAGVMSQQYSIHKTRGNQNNEIGLPLTMFDLAPQHEWAVLEMGMSAPGEIRQLCKISQPCLGVLTNIGEAHIEKLGSKEAILRAKFELAENLLPPGLMILNGDDDLQRRRAQEGLPVVSRIIYYGLNEGNDVRATDIASDIKGSSFTVHWAGKSIPVQLGLPGRHNVSNALAAFAAGVALDIPPEAIAKGLAGVRGEKRRLQTFEYRGMTIIDDSYNANPDSTARALEFLHGYPAQRRKVAFLGDMLELGEIAPEKHRQIGAAAAANGVALLIAVGQFAGALRQGAIEAGMDEKAIMTWPDSKSAAQSLKDLRPDDVVLIKGSLGAKMDVIVHFLKDGGQ